MSRIRSIKPEFWTSEKLAECSTNARLLFIGLWNFCDDRGVHPASARRLKMEVFPGDPFTADEVEAMVDELLRVKLLGRFDDVSGSYWVVTGWHHQKIDRPSYRYPEPPESLEFVEYSPNEQRSSEERSADATPRKGGEGNGEERMGVEEDCSEASETPSEPKAASPSPIPEAAILVFQTVGKSREWPLTASKLAEYRETFPDLDVLAELKKARQWCIDNRAKRKTPEGVPRFLSSWLSRAQNDAGKRAPPGRQNSPGEPGFYDGLKTFVAGEP